MPGTGTVGQQKTFALPDLGEGLTEGEILQWLVAVGDEVVVNQPLAEIETAKAAVELPSPYAGVIAELHGSAGDVIAVGAPLVTFVLGAGSPAAEAAADANGASSPAAEATAAAFDAPPVTDGAAAPDDSAEHPHAASADEGSGPVLVGYGVQKGSTQRRPRVAASPHGTVRPEAGPPGESVKPVRHGGLEVGRAAEAALADQGADLSALATTPTTATTSGPTSGQGVRVRAKPPVRKLAKDLGIDLTAVRATGPDGSITRDDLASYPSSDSGSSSQPSSTGTGTPGLEARRVPLRGVAKHMAEAMVRSAFTAPHVTEWVEVDVTRSVELLARLKRAAAYDGVRVTPMLLVARACLAALIRTPELNASFDDAAQEIVYHPAVNLGFAAATPRGLMVPNIKAAESFALPDLAMAIAELTATAKEGHTPPADLSGGTFTITNVGVFGIDGGTPIINPDEAGILAVGALREKPWVYAGELAVRTVATLSLSFDHRFVDGATGSRFLTDVAGLLEEPALDLAWG
jgi:pyruvate dehydrogenase E2 component (dihydrolipoamide acetyltransferase)